MNHKTFSAAALAAAVAIAGIGTAAAASWRECTRNVRAVRPGVVVRAAAVNDATWPAAKAPGKAMTDAGWERVTVQLDPGVTYRGARVIEVTQPAAVGWVVRWQRVDVIDGECGEGARVVADVATDATAGLLSRTGSTRSERRAGSARDP